MKGSISLVDPLDVKDPQDTEFFDTLKLVACKYIAQLGSTKFNSICSIIICAFPS